MNDLDAGDAPQFDYLTVGHVSVDVLADGTRRAGGTAFYSALQAARLGLRAAILTRGVTDEIEQHLSAHRGELDLFVQPAAETTTLATAGLGAERTQRVLAWAGPIALRTDLSARIVHLAPIARELDEDWLDAAWLDGRVGLTRFLGLTAQGLVRSWQGGDEHVVLATPAVVPAIAERCDAIVVSEHERTSCEELLDAAVRAGASVAITAGPRPTRLITRGETIELAHGEVPQARDDLGAGDVFAAAFFVALDQGRTPADAVAYGNAAAAVRVLGVGAQAIGDVSAIEARLRDRA
jgi:sugar/nucleoside kinase (ribokinase family)